MFILGLSTWLSIDFHDENNLILGFIHPTLYSKTKKAFRFWQNPAKNGLGNIHVLRKQKGGREGVSQMLTIAYRGGTVGKSQLRWAFGAVWNWFFPNYDYVSMTP